MTHTAMSIDQIDATLFSLAPSIILESFSRAHFWT